MAKTKKSVSTATYDDVLIKPKRKGKADLVINHEYAGEWRRCIRRISKNMEIASSVISLPLKMNFARLKFKGSKVVPIKWSSKVKRVIVDLCLIGKVRPQFPLPGVTIPIARQKRLQKDY